MPPVLRALACQIVAGTAAFGVAWSLRTGAGVDASLPLVLAGQGIVAAVLSGRVGLAPWWVPIQLVFPAAVGAALLLPVSPWIYLTIAVALLLVFWNAGGDRVPLYLTNRTTWAALAERLPEGEGGRFIDLGSGLGGTLLYLAKARPDMRFEGIESAPLPYAISRLRMAISGRTNIVFRFGSLWKADLNTYDIVYCFLSPAPMAALYDKVRKEMRTGTLFVSNSFEVPGRPADETLEVDDSRRTRLLIWHV